VESLGEAMKYVAPVAKSLGVSIEETSAMLGLLHNVGIKGSMAGTTLRAMMSRLSAPTGEAAKALRTLGVQTTDAYGKMRPLQEILKDISERLELLPEAKRMEFIKAVFGEEPAAGAIELIVQAKTGGLEKYIKEIKGAQGAATNMVKRMNDTVFARFKALGGAIESLFLTFYKPIEPFLKTGLDMLVGGIRVLTSVLKPLAPIISPVVFGLGALFVASKLAGVGIALVRLQALLGAKSVVSLAGNIPLLIDRLGALAGASNLAGLSFGKMFAVLKVGGLAFLSNPIFLIGTALAGAAYLIIKHWDKVKTFFRGFYKGIEPAIKPVIGLVKLIAAPFRWLFGVIGKLFKNISFEGIGKAIGKAFGFILYPIRLVVTGIKSLVETIFSAFKGVFNFLKKIFLSPLAAINELKGSFSAFGSFLGGVFKNIGKTILAPFSLVKNTVGKVFGFISKPFKWLGGIFGGKKKEEKIIQKTREQNIVKQTEKHFEEHNVIKETEKQFKERNVLSKVLSSDSKETKKVEKERSSKEIKETKESGVIINNLQINIKSDQPAKTLKEKADDIKIEVKKIILDVFDDIRRKQALAYNK